MALLIIALITGPVGDYLGMDYEFFIYSEGYDSAYQPGSDTGDLDVTDTVVVIDTLTHQGHPGYLVKRERDSDFMSVHDTTLSWEVGDSLFTELNLFGMDTLPAKMYVTPFTVGLNWDLGIVGDTLIGDIDQDGTDDTLVVRTAEGQVIDSLAITVPLGTFDAFKCPLRILLSGWTSYNDDSSHYWIHRLQYVTPYLGVIIDSMSIIDSMKVSGNWMWAMTMTGYTAAVDTGYIGIAEQPEASLDLIHPITNGFMIKGSGDYQIKIYDLIGRQCLDHHLKIEGAAEFKPELPSGIYFAFIENNSEISTTKFLIMR